MELGLDKERYSEYGGRDHSHYGSDVQHALSAFRSALFTYQKLGRYKWKHEQSERLDSVQAAFNALVVARKRETGVGTYLDAESYKAAVKKMNTPNFKD